MIHTDNRGSLDERNPTFFGRFPQKHTVVFLSILACCGMMGVPLNSPCFWILYYCVTSVLLLCYYFGVTSVNIIVLQQDQLEYSSDFLLVNCSPIMMNYDNVEQKIETKLPIVHLHKLMLKC